MKKKGRRRKESPAKFREKVFGAAITPSPFSRMEQVEDRTELILAIRDNPDPRIQSLCDQASDPAFSNKSIAMIARSLGLESKHIVEAYRDGKIAEGIVRTFKHLPDVMEDVAIDAKSRYRMCKTCRGTGSYVDPDLQMAADDMDEGGAAAIAPLKTECIDCSGTGKVRIAGDSDARKLVFETAKLTGQRGPMVAIQNNQLDGTETLEQLMSTARQLVTVQPKQLQVAPAEEVTSAGRTDTTER